MINRIHKFIQKEELLQPDDQILLAISGGIDSMCMLEIFSRLEYPIGVAHINHMMRGVESDADHHFVEEACAVLNIPCHSIKIDIKSIAAENKNNVSDTGRTERYAFFNRLCQEHGYTKIATAHHANDDIETVIMRFLEGSGLSGLSGIPSNNGSVIRPLLRLTRDDIEMYVKSRKIAYREDSSNASEDYFRNAIRHQIMPKLSSLKPTASLGMIQSIDNIKDNKRLIESLVEKELENRITKEKETITLDIPPSDYPGRVSLLYYALRFYGFTRSQVIDIADKPLSGSIFHTNEYQGLYDREKLIISKRGKKTSPAKAILIPGIGQFSLNDKDSLKLSLSSQKVFSDNKFIEMIDADKISFPLSLRHWASGDTFRPLGMNGKSQSLQDFFTNEKLSIYQKEQVKLLESEGEIIWVIGHRIADHIKITDETKQYLRLELSQSVSG